MYAVHALASFSYVLKINFEDQCHSQNLNYKSYKGSKGIHLPLAFHSAKRFEHFPTCKELFLRSIFIVFSLLSFLSALFVVLVPSTFLRRKSTQNYCIFLAIVESSTLQLQCTTARHCKFGNDSAIGAGSFFQHRGLCPLSQPQTAKRKSVSWLVALAVGRLDHVGCKGNWT